jgi:hypothetical protein
VLDPHFEVLFDPEISRRTTQKVGSNIEPARPGLFNKKECDLTSNYSWI